MLPSEADIRRWLPGGTVNDRAAFVPADATPDEYDLSIGVLDPATRAPKLKLAIAGVEPDGWYQLGKITVQEAPR